jgi:nucleoside-diphosphate-sugar epimerase
MLADIGRPEVTNHHLATINKSGCFLRARSSFSSQSSQVFSWVKTNTFLSIWPRHGDVHLRAINEGQPIGLFNQRHMRRDFTYIDDVVEALERVIARVPAKGSLPPHGELDSATSIAPWRIYNIGNDRTVEVPPVVELLEKVFGRKAKIELMPMQAGDVPETCADIDELMRDVDFHPVTSFEDGVRNFVAWYKEYHASEYNASSWCATWTIMTP